ncbi:MAG: branched-chain amino acid transport system substrate-binding protein [Rhodospirillaceae bacterium]|nr:branched-chain amino acid transport system substrate-binding protein [Rhodospirillaceae bacterium]
MTNRKMTARYLTGLSAAALLLAGTASAETLKLGFLGAQTGYLAPYDQPSLQGVQLGVKEINDAGGIDGKIKIELISRDMRSDTAESARQAQEMIDMGVNVLITPCEVDPSVAAGQIAQAAQVPAISSCASTPTLPGIVGPYMFSNYTSDNLQGTALAGYAIQQGYKAALILVSRDTPYTHKLPEYFAKVFEAKGGKLLGTVEFKMGQQDFSAEVTKIKQVSPAPDVIMTSAYEPDFPAFIKQLRSAGIKAPVLGSDGIDSPTTFGLGDAAEGVVFSNAGFASEGSPLAKFNAAFKAHFGQEPSAVYTATGYDLVKVIEAAVKAAGDKTDGASLRDAIDNLSDVQGATGKITYKGMNRIPLRSVALNRINSGKRVFVEVVVPDPKDVPKPE